MLSQLLQAPGALAWETRVGDRVAAREWWRLQGALPDGTLVLEVLLELWRAPGADGATRRRRGALVVTPAGQPLLYRSLGVGGGRAVVFAPERLELEVGGVAMAIPRAGAEQLCEVWLAGLDALALWALGPRLRAGPVLSARLHLPQLAVAPWRVERRAGGAGAGAGAVVDSSHDEEFRLDDAGTLTEVVRGRQGHVARRVDLALPAWADQPAEAVVPARRHYRPPPDVDLRDVEIPIGQGTLGATLSLPRGRAAAPVLLYWPGTGRQDRHGILDDVDTQSHALLDGLARRGFAGLRCDPGPDPRREGQLALAGAALDWLATQAGMGLRATRCYVIGHSQGGGIALELATRRPLAGVVLLATLGRRLEVALEAQLRALAASQGWPARALAAELADLGLDLEIIRAEAAGRPAPAPLPDHLAVRARDRAWLAAWLPHCNADLVARARCPVLVCQGGRDQQVTPADAEALAAAARQAAVPLASVDLPDADHCLRDPGGALAPALLDAVTNWLGQREAELGDSVNH